MWRYEANDNTARTPTQEGRGDWRGITGIVSVISVTDVTFRHVFHFIKNRGEGFHNVCRTDLLALLQCDCVCYVCYVMCMSHTVLGVYRVNGIAGFRFVFRQGKRTGCFPVLRKQA